MSFPSKNIFNKEKNVSGKPEPGFYKKYRIPGKQFNLD